MCLCGSACVCLLVLVYLCVGDGSVCVCDDCVCVCWWILSQVVLASVGIPYVTDCVMAELEKLGAKYRVALRIVKDPRFERLSCLHKGTYADDCLVQRVTQVSQGLHWFPLTTSSVTTSAWFSFSTQNYLLQF